MKATVEIQDRGFPVEHITHYVPDMVVTDADAYQTTNFLGYDKALLGTFGCKLNTDTDEGLRTLPHLPNEDKALLIEGQAINIKKSRFDFPRNLQATDVFTLTYKREYYIGGRTIKMDMFKKSYDIDHSLTATHVTTFNFADALGYVHTALGIAIGEDNATREAPEKSKLQKGKSTTNWAPYCQGEDREEQGPESNRLVA